MFDVNRDPQRALRLLRRDIIDMAERSPHVAAALSCVDIIAALYFGVLKVRPDQPTAEGRDIFILSKGHGCMALYAVLFRVGFITREVLDSYSQDYSCLAEHPLAGKVPGLEFAAGSLGHGLAVGAGMAKAFKLRGQPNRVFVLLGDGECDEGAVWEGAALSSAHRLDNLTAIVDANGLQACGRCADISQGVSLSACWSAFGWQVQDADGHDFRAMQCVFGEPNAPSKPRAVICRTVKGKGIDFMEGNLEYHYRPIRGTEREEAIRRLTDA